MIQNKSVGVVLCYCIPADFRIDIGVPDDGPGLIVRNSVVIEGVQAGEAHAGITIGYRTVVYLQRSTA
jgi:hypothetical protein